MLPSTGGVELRLATYIFVGDSLRGKVGFWSFWMLLLKWFLGGSSSENRKSSASPVCDWTYKGVMGYFSGDLSAVWEQALLNYYQHVCSCWTLSIWNFVLKMRHTYTHTYIKVTWYWVCEWVNFPSAAWLCAVHVSCCTVDVCIWESWFGDEVITMLKVCN
jgi:hypothetical protein